MENPPDLPEPNAFPPNFSDVFPDLKDVPPGYIVHALAEKRGRISTSLYIPSMHLSSLFIARAFRAWFRPTQAASRMVLRIFPLLILSLPFPQHFDILHTFMYTHRVDIALQQLLKLPDLSHGMGRGIGDGQDISISDWDRDLQHISHTFGIPRSPVLLRQYQDIKQMTEDMVSLGFNDYDFRATVEQVRLALQSTMKERQLDCS
ncbi:hypothetical protein B0H14DRAFT_2586721 [Mycena olivaceomarginata]|nr:hypothetical protein B0H14DRAFT_2586721 [Mycena olivaceomarginata]